MPTATATSVPTWPSASGITCWSPATAISPTRMWPTVRAAIDFVLDLQLEGGEICWARSPSGPLTEALLTGCASIFHSIRCALALANLIDEPQPEWELALGRLGHAIAVHPSAFTEKPHHSMDWYYPILGGALARTRRDGPNRGPLERFRGRRTGHPVRRRPAVGDRRGDLRTGAGARRDGRPRGGAALSSPPCSTCARRTARTGPAWCSATESVGLSSAPPGPARR